MTLPRPLIITAGEPAGIGPELCLALARSGLATDIVVLSDPDLLQARAAMTGIDVIIREISLTEVGATHAADGELLVIAQRFPEQPECGRPNPVNAQTLLDGLRHAVAGCVDYFRTEQQIVETEVDYLFIEKESLLFFYVPIQVCPPFRPIITLKV